MTRDISVGCYVKAGPPASCAPYVKRRRGGFGVRIASDAKPWTVPDLCRAYQWPANLPGGGVIGIVELGGGYLASDIATFCQNAGQPIPDVTDHIVGTDAGNNPGPAQPISDADTEVALDIQVAAAAYFAASGKPATIRMYWASGTEPGAIAAAVRQAAADGCDVCSISWGADEALWEDWGRAAGIDFIQDLQNAVEVANQGGMIVFAASGDNDDNDGGPNAVNVDVPSSCPNVVGCGGTTKTANNEIVWNNSPGQSTGEGTGGGFSDRFARPPWQPKGLGDDTKRMVPDVAANADPNTGYEIIVHGQLLDPGGTSAVAPLYAGLFAAFGRKLGNVLPKLWANEGCFNDIVEGDNGKVYAARTGPDPCTGLGTPVGTALAALFPAAAQPPAIAPAAPAQPAGAPPNPPTAAALAASAFARVSLASPSLSASFDPQAAVLYGRFVQAVYTMYNNDTANNAPAASHDFPAGYRLLAWIQMKDFLVSSTSPVFYGIIAQSVLNPNHFVVAIRGTQSLIEWWDDGNAIIPQPFKLPNCGSVGAGFARIYDTMAIIENTGARPHAVPPRPAGGTGGFSHQVRELVMRHTAASPAIAGFGAQATVDVTGHSLGGALATLYALENAISEKVANRTICTFASPRVGDPAFAAAFNALGLTSWRIVNEPDLVPKLPLLGFEHVREPETYNSSGLVQPGVGCWHALATYLSLVDRTIPPGADCALAVPAIKPAALAVRAAASPANFYTGVIQHDPRFRSTARIDDLALLEPGTRAAVQAVVADAKQQGIDLIVFETYRSLERQQMLFARGVTKLKEVGVHHYGLACDLVKRVDGEPNWKGDYSFLAPLARRHNLISGLDWGAPNKKHDFVDSDHVQRCTLGRQASLFAGTWYPDASYNPYADGAK